MSWGMVPKPALLRTRILYLLWRWSILRWLCRGLLPARSYMRRRTGVERGWRCSWRRWAVLDGVAWELLRTALVRYIRTAWLATWLRPCLVVIRNWCMSLVLLSWWTPVVSSAISSPVSSIVSRRRASDLRRRLRGYGSSWTRVLHQIVISVGLVIEYLVPSVAEFVN